MAIVGISTVLAEIDQTISETGEPVTFSLDYTRKDATVGHIEKAQKGVKDTRHQEEGELEGKKAFNHNLRELGNIHLYNHDKQAYRELNIYLLRRYNGHKIHFG